MKEEDIAGIVLEEIKLLDTKLTTLEGTVLSIYMSSLTIKNYVPNFLHLLRQILVSIIVHLVIWCVPWQVLQQQNQIFHFVLNT